MRPPAPTGRSRHRTSRSRSNLLKATAWQESGWQSNIYACDGGVGLLQVMPDTADWMNQRFERATRSTTYQDNAYLGATYLAWATKYIGDMYFESDFRLDPATVHQRAELLPAQRRHRRVQLRARCGGAGGEAAGHPQPAVRAQRTGADERVRLPGVLTGLTGGRARIRHGPPPQSVQSVRGDRLGRARGGLAPRVAVMRPGHQNRSPSRNASAGTSTVRTSRVSSSTPMQTMIPIWVSSDQRQHAEHGEDRGEQHARAGDHAAGDPQGGEHPVAGAGARASSRARVTRKML